MSSLSVKVDNLPKNSLAYTNAIYLNPSDHVSLSSSVSAESSPESSNGPTTLLLNVGYFVFLALPHASVEPERAAMNGLQRQCASLTLNQGKMSRSKTKSKTKA